MNDAILALYSDRDLECLSQKRSGAKFREYLSKKLLKRKEPFRSMVDVEEWMIRESLRFVAGMSFDH